MNIKTIYDLIYWHETLNPDSKLFDSNTMRFFGDTATNFRVKKTPEGYEVRRKKAVKGLSAESGYLFDSVSLKRTATITIGRG